jgi:hypothetical protein
MTPQERVIAALSFQQPDRVPLFDTYWEEFVARWRREKGLPESADIAAHYGVDIAIAIGDDISVAAYDHFVQTLRRLGDYPLRSV